MSAIQEYLHYIFILVLTVACVAQDAPQPINVTADIDEPFQSLPNYKQAEAFTPKEVFALLYGEKSVDQSQGRRDSFDLTSYNFNPDIVNPQWSADGNSFSYIYRVHNGWRQANVDPQSATQQILEIEAPSEDKQNPHNSYSPDGFYEVYTEGHDLFLKGPNGSQQRLSSDGEEKRSFAQQDGSFDSQKPLSHRIGWFPNGKYFWVER